MKSLWHKLALVLMFALPLSGCGGGGTPDSPNSLDTGVVIESILTTPKDEQESTPDIDMNVHLCPPDFTTAEPGLFRANVTMQISASRLNPNIDYDPFPASVEACTITYLKANEDPAGPVIEQLTVYPNCALQSSTSDCSMTLMDIQRKRDWWRMVNFGANLPAEYPTHYVARIRCSFTTRYGKTGSFQTETDLWLADWEKC